MTTPRVALVMLGVGHLHGSGGAERHFSDLFEYFRTAGAPVSLITDTVSVERLQSAGYLRNTDGVVALRLGSQPVRGRLNTVRLTAALLGRTLGGRFDVVHICLPTPTYVPYCAIAGRMPASLRPRLALSVIDCTVAPNLLVDGVDDDYERQVIEAHRMYAAWVKLDGIFTWYRAFADVASRLHLFPGRTAIVAAKYCFTDTARFRPSPQRDRLIVFAGRLSAQKRPLLFVDAIARLIATEPALASGWRFEIYGLGPLEGDVRQRITQHGLDQVVRVTHAADLASVFARSRAFVSTQAIENFTSLAMLEAMSAGNAVIAEDVGQTSEFVHDGENGLLVRPATAAAFADAIAAYLRTPERHESMAAASRAIATNVHTIEHAAADISAFWQTVAGQ